MYTMYNYSPSVPQPVVTTALNNTGTLYAGTGFTLTFTVILNSTVDNNERVVTQWSDTQPIPSDRYKVTNTTRKSGSIFSGSLTISPLVDQDDGTYTCTVTVTGGANVQPATASDSVTITVMGEYNIMVFVLPVHIVAHNLFLHQPYQLQ